MSDTDFRKSLYAKSIVFWMVIFTLGFAGLQGYQHLNAMRQDGKISTVLLALRNFAGETLEVTRDLLALANKPRPFENLTSAVRRGESIDPFFFDALQEVMRRECDGLETNMILCDLDQHDEKDEEGCNLAAATYEACSIYNAVLNDPTIVSNSTRNQIFRKIGIAVDENGTAIIDGTTLGSLSNVFYDLRVFREKLSHFTVHANYIQRLANDSLFRHQITRTGAGLSRALGGRVPVGRMTDMVLFTIGFDVLVDYYYLVALGEATYDVMTSNQNGDLRKLFSEEEQWGAVFYAALIKSWNLFFVTILVLVFGYVVGEISPLLLGLDFSIKMLERFCQNHEHLSIPLGALLLLLKGITLPFKYGARVLALIVFFSYFALFAYVTIVYVIQTFDYMFAGIAGIVMVIYGVMKMFMRSKGRIGLFVLSLVFFILHHYCGEYLDMASELIPTHPNFTLDHWFSVVPFIVGNTFRQIPLSLWRHISSFCVLAFMKIARQIVDCFVTSNSDGIYRMTNETSGSRYWPSAHWSLKLLSYANSILGWIVPKYAMMTRVVLFVASIVPPMLEIGQSFGLPVAVPAFFPVAGSVFSFFDSSYLKFISH